MDTAEETKQIDFVKIAQVIRRNKRLYFYSLPIVFVVASALILCVPRYYRCTLKLAPELSSMSSSSIADLASSFGFDVGGSSSGSDAIFPELYPDLIGSFDFITSLLPVQVENYDGTIHTTYYEYMSRYQKAPFWSKCVVFVKNLFSDKEPGSSSDVIDPYRMTRRQYGLIKAVGKNIDCDVDKKNYVISITVTDQDRLVCTTMADTVTQHLQDFITDYRTKKSRNDLAHAVKLQAEAREKYLQAQRAYAQFCDANQDVVLESLRSKQEALENEMQLQYNNYSALTVQVQSSEAKVQENTPAFTTLQSATVPVKPAGPKRMLFVLAMLFLTFLIDTGYLLVRDK